MNVSKKREVREMPTYEYECPYCGYNFEMFQKITEAPLQDCPKCSGRIKRLIGSGSGIIFKGAGFYATDYRKKSKTESTESTATKPQAGSCPQAKTGCPMNTSGG